ncbi:MAG: hypothetical protein ACLVEZ_01565 [Mediterraneibacter faecis]
MNDDLQWNRGGEAAGVIGIERIAIGRNKWRGKTGMFGERFFFFLRY